MLKQNYLAYMDGIKKAEELRDKLKVDYTDYVKQNKVCTKFSITTHLI